MVVAFDVYNLVQYEVAKVADELLELVILIWISFIPFSSFHYKRTSFGLVFHTMYEVFIIWVKRFKLTLKGCLL